MSILVPIAMFGWLPVVLGLFWLLPARRAIIVAFLFAWLFLPMAEYKIAGIPAYTKMTATCVGVMVAAVVFDGKRLLRFRPRWFDLPMGVWCLCPFLSSTSNGLGAYDGCSAVVYQTITWGVPYLIGRVYFTNLEGLKELAVGIFIGGLIYVPLCLYEIKMSPQLHRMLYGFHQHEFVQTKRWGGWRPMVFMQHGLMVGMWMTTALLAGVWLWRTGALRRLWTVPVGWLLLALLVTTVLCKSAGALALLAVGLVVLYVVRWTRLSLAVWCLVAMAPLYMGLRATGVWSGEKLVVLSREWVGVERSESLATRLKNEDQLAAKVLQQPMLGWGGWGRSLIYDEAGGDISVTDGLWVLALGEHGIVGLASLTIALLLPVVLVLWRCPTKYWSHPALAPLVALAMILSLYVIDCVPNAMVNPIFVLAGGAIATVVYSFTFKQSLGMAQSGLPVHSALARVVVVDPRKRREPW